MNNKSKIIKKRNKNKNGSSKYKGGKLGEKVEKAVNTTITN